MEVFMFIADKMLRTLQRALRINMLLGLSVTIIATYLLITGTYDNIQTRQVEETFLGWVAIVGLLYTFSFWIACVFRKQFFQKTVSQS